MQKLIVSTVTVALSAIAFASITSPATAGRFCGSQVKSGEASGKTETEAKTAAMVW
jgi:hypothetical protein